MVIQTRVPASRGSAAVVTETHHMMHILSAALAAAIALAFAACGGGNSSDDGFVVPTPTDSPTELPTPDDPTPTDAVMPEVSGLTAVRHTNGDLLFVVVSWDMVNMFSEYDLVRDVDEEENDKDFRPTSSPFRDETGKDLLIKEIRYRIRGVTMTGEMGPETTVAIPPDFSWLNGTARCNPPPAEPDFEVTCEVRQIRLLYCTESGTPAVVNGVSLNPMEPGLTLSPGVGFIFNGVECTMMP